MQNRTRRVLVLGGAQDGDALTAILRETYGIETVLVRPPVPGAGRGTQQALHLLIERHSDLDDLMRRADAVVIAAHPFSGSFAMAAAEAAARHGLPCLRLMREPWRPGPNDLWIGADGPRAAASEVIRGGYLRIFLSVGRDQVDPFLALGGRDLFVRLPGPGPSVPIRRGRVLTDPGPFSVASEMDLLRRLGAQVLVARNIGGRGGWPKLQAARMMRLPVILMRRPPAPDCDLRHSVEDAMAWLTEKLALDLEASVA
jgi:precorrin-6A/cobalt-precorrin-6A reductase